MINFSINITGIVTLGLVKILFFLAYVNFVSIKTRKGRKTWGFDK